MDFLAQTGPKYKLDNVYILSQVTAVLGPSNSLKENRKTTCSPIALSLYSSHHSDTVPIDLKLSWKIKHLSVRLVFSLVLAGMGAELNSLVWASPFGLECGSMSLPEPQGSGLSDGRMEGREKTFPLSPFVWSTSALPTPVGPCGVGAGWKPQADRALPLASGCPDASSWATGAEAGLDLTPASP